MHEQRRQAYLQAFDIDSYEPRWVLPNALPSVACEYDWFDEAAAGGELLAAEPPEAVAAAASNSLEGNVEPPARERTYNIDVSVGSKSLGDKNAVAKPAALQKPQAQLRFALSIWRVTPGLLVVDSRRPRLALPTDALLLNILRALGYDLQRLPAMEQVRWPVTAAHGSADEQVRDARAYVQAYLQAQAGHFPFSRVLLMGASAVRFSLDEAHWPDDDDPRALLGKQFAMDCIQGAPGNAAVPNAIVVPSLSAMLQAPAMKAVTWRAIQPLRHNPLRSVSS